MIMVSVCGVLLLALLSIVLKSRAGFKEIDAKYGKPYKAKLVRMIGGHPELKQGSVAMAFHPKDAISFNRLVFPFDQISSIKTLSRIPDEYNDRQKTTVNHEEKEYLCISVTDESGDHEIVFAAKSGFKELSDQLIKKWNMYNLLTL